MGGISSREERSVEEQESAAIALKKAEMSLLVDEAMAEISGYVDELQDNFFDVEARGVLKAHLSDLVQMPEDEFYVGFFDHMLKGAQEAAEKKAREEGQDVADVKAQFKTMHTVGTDLSLIRSMAFFGRERALPPHIQAFLDTRRDKPLLTYFFLRSYYTLREEARALRDGLGSAEQVAAIIDALDTPDARKTLLQGAIQQTMYDAYNKVSEGDRDALYKEMSRRVTLSRAGATHVPLKGEAFYAVLSAEDSLFDLKDLQDYSKNTHKEDQDYLKAYIQAYPHRGVRWVQQWVDKSMPAAVKHHAYWDRVNTWVSYLAAMITGTLVLTFALVPVPYDIASGILGFFERRLVSLFVDYQTSLTKERQRERMAQVAIAKAAQSGDDVDQADLTNEALDEAFEAEFYLTEEAQAAFLQEQKDAMLHAIEAQGEGLETEAEYHAALVPYFVGRESEMVALILQMGRSSKAAYLAIQEDRKQDIQARTFVEVYLSAKQDVVDQLIGQIPEDERNDKDVRYQVLRELERQEIRGMGVNLPIKRRLHALMDVYQQLLTVPGNMSVSEAIRFYPVRLLQLLAVSALVVACSLPLIALDATVAFVHAEVLGRLLFAVKALTCYVLAAPLYFMDAVSWAGKGCCFASNVNPSPTQGHGVFDSTASKRAECIVVEPEGVVGSEDARSTTLTPMGYDDGIDD
jgi:hypothetical protein